MIKNALRNLKNQTFDPIEVRVRDATSSDPWGAPSSLMADIADATHDYTQYPKLFQMLWKRLRDYQIHMHVQKALLLVEYLVRNGSDRFVRDAQHRADDVAKLKRYKYYNKDNEDIAADIRKKAKSVHDMLLNEEILRTEREKAAQLRGAVRQHAGSSPRTNNYDNASFAPAPSATRTSSSTVAPSSNNNQDPYDNYSQVSREEAARAREEVGRRPSQTSDVTSSATAPVKKATKKTKPKTEDNPFSQPVEENPFDKQPTESKKTAKKKTSNAVSEEEPPAKLDQPAQSKKTKGKTKPQTTTAAASAPAMPDIFGQDPFAPTPVDPFDPANNNPRKANARNVLDTVLGQGSQNWAANQAAVRNQPGGQLDLLTNAFEATNVSGPSPWDEEEAPHDGGRVDWGPDKSDDEDDEGATAPAPAGGDIWDLAGNLANLDNISAEKKAAKTAAGKPGKTMAELQKKKPAVIMGTAIDGFEAAPSGNVPQPGPAVQMGYPQGGPAYGYPPQSMGYPPGPSYGYPQPMAYQPAPVYGAPMGYAPAVAPAQMMGRPQSRPPQPAANNPFPF